MRYIAAIHIAVLITTWPLAYLLLRKCSASFVRSFAVSILLIWVLSILLLTQFWPFDYVFSRLGSLIEVNIKGYRIQIVQWPETDFYKTNVLVSRDDGGEACLLLDSDDSKWWGIVVSRKNGNIVVSKWGGLVPEVIISTDANQIMFPRRNRTENLENLQFNTKHGDCWMDNLDLY